jgi:hypothetical protein
MNIYSNHLQRVQLDPYRVKHSVTGFKKDLGKDEFIVAAEMLRIYEDVKGREYFDGKFELMFDILKTMATYVYPKPTMNIMLSPGEVVAIPPELEGKSSEELLSLLPPAA